MNDIDFIIERISYQKKEILSYLEQRLNEVKEEYQPPSTFVQLSIEQMKSSVEQSLSKYDRIVSSVEVRLGSLTRFNEEVLTTIKEFSSKLHYMDSIVNSFNNANNSLSSSLEEQWDKLKCFQSEFSDSISRLDSELSDLEKSKTGLYSSLSLLNKSLSSTNKSIEDLRCDFRIHVSDTALERKLSKLEENIIKLSTSLEGFDIRFNEFTKSFNDRLESISSHMISLVDSQRIEFDRKIPEIPKYDLSNELSELKF